MRKHAKISSSGKEFFLTPPSARPEPAQPAPEGAAEKIPQAQAAGVPDETVPRRKTNEFAASVDSFSSANTAKPRRKGRRKLGLEGFLRLIAICACIGIFAFSLLQIMDRLSDLSDAEEAYDRLSEKSSNKFVAHPKPARRVPFSKDLIAFLGSDTGGIELLDIETQNYYEELRGQVLKIRRNYPDCVGYITVSDTRISYPIMKGKDNNYYLNRLYNGEFSRAGSVFADYRMSDDYYANLNYVIYGHCMTNGSMFRALKLFFDSKYRYSRAQEMKITVVTADTVYIYEYFAGYRSEGNSFTKSFIDNGKNTSYCNFLRKLRGRNTIPKETGYNANSRIVTLVTCTNLAALPDERYVLHGILTDCFTFD